MSAPAPQSEEQQKSQPTGHARPYFNLSRVVAAGLERQIRAKPGSPIWRRDAGSDQPFALKLTAAGLKLAGTIEETEGSIEAEGSALPEVVVEAAKASDAAAGEPKHSGDIAPRAGSKLAEVVAMLRRSEGITLDDLTAATGWLPHTTRAAMTGLRKRSYSVIRERMENGASAYRISEAPIGGSDALASASKAASSRPRRERAKQAA